MKWPRVTLRGILWATFWAAVCLASWILDYKPADQNPALLFAIFAIRLLSPFVAIGALVGHSLKGLAVGIILTVIYAIAFALMANLGWIEF